MNRWTNNVFQLPLMLCFLHSLIKCLLCIEVFFSTSSLFTLFLVYHSCPHNSNIHLYSYIWEWQIQSMVLPLADITSRFQLSWKQSRPNAHCGPSRLCQKVNTPDESYFSDLYVNDSPNLYLQHWSFQTPFSNCFLDTPICSSLSFSTVPGAWWTLNKRFVQQ